MQEIRILAQSFQYIARRWDFNLQMNFGASRYDNKQKTTWFSYSDIDQKPLIVGTRACLEVLLEGLGVLLPTIVDLEDEFSHGTHLPDGRRALATESRRSPGRRRCDEYGRCGNGSGVVVPVAGT